MLQLNQPRSQVQILNSKFLWILKAQLETIDIVFYVNGNNKIMNW